MRTDSVVNRAASFVRHSAARYPDKMRMTRMKHRPTHWTNDALGSELDHLRQSTILFESSAGRSCQLTSIELPIHVQRQDCNLPVPNCPIQAPSNYRGANSRHQWEMDMLRKLLRVLFGQRAKTGLEFIPVRPVPAARLQTAGWRGRFAMSP